MNIIFVLFTFTGYSSAELQKPDFEVHSSSEPSTAAVTDINAKIIPAVEHVNHEGKDSSCIDRCWDRYDNQGVSPTVLPGYQNCIKSCDKGL